MRPRIHSLTRTPDSLLLPHPNPSHTLLQVLAGDGIARLLLQVTPPPPPSNIESFNCTCAWSCGCAHPSPLLRIPTSPSAPRTSPHPTPPQVHTHMEVARHPRHQLAALSSLKATLTLLGDQVRAAAIFRYAASILLRALRGDGAQALCCALLAEMCGRMMETEGVPVGWSWVGWGEVRWGKQGHAGRRTSIPMFLQTFRSPITLVPSEKHHKKFNKIFSIYRFASPVTSLPSQKYHNNTTFYQRALIHVMSMHCTTSNSC
jgi:hypothetical protein